MGLFVLIDPFLKWEKEESGNSFQTGHDLMYEQYLPTVFLSKSIALVWITAHIHFLTQALSKIWNLNIQVALYKYTGSNSDPRDTKALSIKKLMRLD